MRGLLVILAAGAALIAFVAVFSSLPPPRATPQRTNGEVWLDQCTKSHGPSKERIDLCVWAKTIEAVSRSKNR